MLTSKQRSRLRALANGIDPVTQIGKGGITPSVVRALSTALEARELIKVTVLESCGVPAAELIQTLAEQTFSEPVQAMGNKITLYRRSERKNFDHIKLDV